MASSHRGSRRWVLAAAAAMVTFGSTVQPGASTLASVGPARVDDATQPNIVVILTDDQRWDTLWAMPNVQSLLQAQGMTFANAFVSNSDCCPSRASILTGNYSHTTGVYTDEPGPYGGVTAFDPTSTVATWLHDAGYRTALIGKYLNGYQVTDPVPPGWDEWFANDGGGNRGGYYDYTVSDNGTPSSYGSADTDYSTDVFANQADAFIRGTDPAQPLFLELAPHAPHRPWTPAPRHAVAFMDLAPWRPPNWNERNVSDKPAWVQALPKLNRVTVHDHNRVNQYRTLLAVDDAVAEIVQALTDTGRLADTMIVFTSDNGFTWGEHRLFDTKFSAYEESIRVPLVIRFDGVVAPGTTADQIVANIDFAPTFAEVAGVTPATTPEGLSLMPLLTSTSTTWRDALLLEHLSPQGPPFCGLRTPHVAYVAYSTGEEELYKLMSDPYELANVASDPDNAKLLANLRSELAVLCDPPPPGLGPVASWRGVMPRRTEGLVARRV